jgi:hypothetical protein
MIDKITDKIPRAIAYMLFGLAIAVGSQTSVWADQTPVPLGKGLFVTFLFVLGSIMMAVTEKKLNGRRNEVKRERRRRCLNQVY